MTPFLSNIYVGPHNEYVDDDRADGWRGRILYDGTEVATLLYCEDYRWAKLYAKAPELLAALRELIDASFCIVELYESDTTEYMTVEPAIKKALAVLQRATGESP